MFGRKRSYQSMDPRSRMIAETSAFLTAALNGKLRVGPIPRRRVSKGGYEEMLARPGGRAAVNHWWGMAMKKAEEIERTDGRD